MARLSRKDLGSVLELSLEAHACEGVESFCRDVLPQLRRVVPGDTIGYNEIDLEKRTALLVTDPPDVGFNGIEDRLIGVIHQHPVAACQRSGDLRPWKLSDFLSVRRYHGLDLYRELYRPLGYEDQFAFGLPGVVMVPILISRSRRTFTERDREVLGVLRPHLAHAYGNLVERTRVRALVHSLEAGMERRDAAIIQLDRSGRVTHLPRVARDLLDAYCERPAGIRLPASIEQRMKSESWPLTINGPRGRLHVKLVDDRDVWPALLIEEQRTTAPDVEALEQLGLTRRQAQVLRLVATEKRNDQIAQQLAISPQTVRKHLEHIYRRLGVNSKVQAIARVRS